MAVEEQIQHLIKKIRPYINRDGGDIKFAEFTDGIVFIEFLGACATCGIVNTTLYGIEEIFIESIDEVIGVVQL